MTVSPADQPLAAGLPASVTARVHAAITQRLGEQRLTPSTELAAIGVDSLLLLRILGDLAVDPTQEIDPYQLADVITVADLAAFVEGWN
ncbi:phosphopantetheine-binding protein [Streptomyces sp. NPDC057445]|uniref:phosphopantetheine-binding protein n=1 Tax=Streptomyces sp. NPDC057445 TaxID=3346136 RepID=UPI0036BE893F